LKRTAIILAGGFSSRLGQDKGLLQLAGKPLIKHILDLTKDILEERIIVVSSDAQAEKYSRIIKEDVKITKDDKNLHGPLAGAFAGFKNASGEYSLLLPCDTPLINKAVASLLLELCINKSAAIPRWPNCYIEPLQAAYCTKPAIHATNMALSEGKTDLQSMISKLAGVRYISTLVIQQLDPELKTFFNINTMMDLKKAETMLQNKIARLHHDAP